MLSSSASVAIELDMDLTAANIMRRRKSLAVLQKIDPKVLDIVFDCPHVAIYRFIVGEQEKRWERLGVEGALFITANASDDRPAHSLIVLNRRGIRLLYYMAYHVDSDSPVLLYDMHALCRDDRTTGLHLEFINDDENQPASAVLDASVLLWRGEVG